MNWHTTFVNLAPGHVKTLERELDRLQEEGHTIFSIIGPILDGPGGHMGIIIVSKTDDT